MSNQQDLQLYLLNENNKYVTRSFLQDVLARYGVQHQIQDMETFQRAFIHTTYLINDPNINKGNRVAQIRETVTPMNEIQIKDVIPLQKRSYERLEFIGDARIHDIIGFYLFNRYPTQDEGFLTRLRTKLENKPALAQYSKIINFDKYVMISKYLEVTDGRNSIHVLEDTFESFIGALALEASYDVCRTFFINFIESEIDIALLLCHETNYKDALMQYYHKQGWGVPKYFMSEEIELDNGKKRFKMYVTNKHGQPAGYGEGVSKKKGEQEAAKEVLLKYGVLDESSSDDNTDTD